MSTRLQEKLKQVYIGGFCALLLGAPGIVSAATEVEPNDAQAQAQILGITDAGVSVSASMGSGGMTTDLDLYAFDAKAGDVPIIMVVSDGNWDAFLVLYDAAGNILDMNDDAYPMNPNSNSPLDSRIDMYRVPADGRYYVAVTPVPRYLDSGFAVVFTDAGAGGSYSVSIQGVTPPVVVVEPDPAPTPDPDPVVDVEPDPAPTPDPDPVVEVEPEPTESSSTDPMVATILIKHWRGQEAGLGKYRGKDPMPVAILSSPEFDAMTIDQSSLTFGATGEERSLVRCRKHGKDVKVDGVKDHVKDLVCYFRPDVAGFKDGDVQGFLRARTAKGEKIEASAALNLITVSNKKDKSWHKNHNVDPRGKKYQKRAENKAKKAAAKARKDAKKAAKQARKEARRN